MHTDPLNCTPDSQQYTSVQQYTEYYSVKAFFVPILQHSLDRETCTA